MKKSFAVVAGIAVAGMLFSACSSSSSSSDASLAEKCAKGVTEECLEGATWNMNGLYNQQEDGSYQLITHPFANPSILVFNSSKKEGKTFSLTYSSDPIVEGVGGMEDSGEWSVDNGTLTLQFGRVGSLHTNTTKLIHATIVYLDNAVALNLNSAKRILHTTISEPGIEIFTGIEK